MPIRILQINLNGTRRVVAEATEAAITNKVDIVTVQEPYIAEGTIVGSGINTTKVYQGGVDARNVALVIFNSGIRMTKVEGLSDKNFVIAEITGEGIENLL